MAVQFINKERHIVLSPTYKNIKITFDRTINRQISSLLEQVTLLAKKICTALRQPSSINLQFDWRKSSRKDRSIRVHEITALQVTSVLYLMSVSVRVKICSFAFSTGFLQSLFWNPNKPHVYFYALSIFSLWIFLKLYLRLACVCILINIIIQYRRTYKSLRFVFGTQPWSCIAQRLFAILNLERHNTGSACKVTTSVK